MMFLAKCSWLVEWAIINTIYHFKAKNAAYADISNVVLFRVARISLYVNTIFIHKSCDFNRCSVYFSIIFTTRGWHQFNLFENASIEVYTSWECFVCHRTFGRKMYNLRRHLWTMWSAIVAKCSKIRPTWKRTGFSGMHKIKATWWRNLLKCQWNRSVSRETI